MGSKLYAFLPRAFLSTSWLTEHQRAMLYKATTAGGSAYLTEGIRQMAVEACPCSPVHEACA